MSIAVFIYFQLYSFLSYFLVASTSWACVAVSYPDHTQSYLQQDFRVGCDDGVFASLSKLSMCLLAACFVLPPICVSVYISRKAAQDQLHTQSMRCRLGFL